MNWPVSAYHQTSPLWGFSSLGFGDYDFNTTLISSYLFVGPCGLSL